MKKLFASLILSVCLVPALLTTGCKSPANQQTAARIASASKVAAYMGTAEYLRDHAASRPKFETARDSLLVIETSEHVDLATLLAIVRQLPIDELKSERAVMFITATTILLSDWAGGLPVDELDDLKPVAAAIRQGIDLGLKQK